MMYPLFAVFSPALAAGAAVVAIGVPLVVHLLFRKRYQVVPWAAIRFLLVAERRHKRRIDQWILLALRTSALMLLLFALIATTPWAEAVWQKIKPGASETTANVPRTHHVIVLDASLSMTAKGEGEQTRFQRAVEQAEDLILKRSRPGDGYTVFVLKATLQPVVPGLSNDPEKVVAELRKVKPTHGPADHAGALATVAEVLTRSPRAYPRRQVTFFTDLQRSSWVNATPRAENTTAELWQRIVTRSDVAIVDTAGRDADNLAIADLALVDPMPLVDQPVSITVAVANLGRGERKNVRVELLLGRPSGGGDALVSVEQRPVDPIPAGGRQSVRFDLDQQHRFRERGVHVLQARLVEGDALVADDSRAIAVEVRDGLHALLVDGRADPDVNRRAATFLSRALFPPEAKYTLTPARPSVVTPAEFLDSAVCDLTNVDCVFFCDVPNPIPDMAAKLDALLRRGGTVVFGLGPNAAASRERYNAVFYRDGAGVLPGALGDVVAVTGPDDPGFRLVADEEDYRRPPLAFFAGDKTRPGLINVLFRTYMRIDAPPGGRARRLMTFSHAGTTPAPTSAAKPDPAVVEWGKHRGRVYVFTSTFNEEWNAWPKARSYLEFWNEFLTYSVANPDRHTLRAGEPIEEFFPAANAGLTAGLNGPDHLSATVPLVMKDEAGVALFTDTDLSGLYRMGLNGARDRVFAVNAPEVVTGTPTESDLTRIDPRELRSLGAQVVAEPGDVTPTSESGADVTTAPKPHGPRVARLASLFVVLFLVTELILAWVLGPARRGGAGAPPARALVVRLLALAGALVPLVLGAFVLFALFHADRTNNPLGFLPHDTRSSIERAAEVPTAGPGEGTRWRLEGGGTAFFKNTVTDRRTVATLACVCLVFTFGVYWVERRAAGGIGRVAVPALLRSVTLLLALFVVLAQLRLAFDREGLPEIVILLDTSASMNTRDQLRDPLVRARAEELAGTTDLSEVNRLKLAQLLLTRKGADWLDKLLHEKQVKVHIFAIDTQKRPVATVEEAGQLEDARDALKKLEPLGDGSKLGDGVEEVLKEFRGSTLSAIIMFTDGVTTAGDDLPKVAARAARDGVPLFLVGTGDPWLVPDLALTDIQAEDVVGRGDQLVFKARLTAKGNVPATPVTVSLKERLANGNLEDRGQVTVTPDPNGNPVDVTVTHIPMEIGEKTFILSVPTVSGETNTRNNKIERMVLVTESRRIRVLYVEGYPRYDFRFVKVMLERESDKSIGGKAVEVQVVLLDASKGWAGTDRSAFRGDFPTRTELFNYDVVILGDVDPKLVPRAAIALRDLADFVKEKGGGLLFLCGEHGSLAAYTDTPLGEVLPVVPGDAPMATRPPEEQSITEGFRPWWTPTGKQHPLFLLSPDEAASNRIWGQFQELLWYAKGYRPKPLARVLATHPTLRAEGGAAGENHPLIVQQFVGNGPVLFFGFDDTWRWRFRNDEEHFDRFWMQAVRVLSRSRVRRPEVHIEPKTEFRRDEKVTVQVRFPIESPAPVGTNPVRVTMTRSPLVKPDGTPGAGATEVSTLTLARSSRPTVLFETTLARALEGEYRFELTDPEVQGSRPFATARVLPPMDESERTELNQDDLTKAASISGGGYYTLATATDIFNDLKNLQRVPLNQPCPPVPLWNHPLLYVLLLSLLLTEWLLRKRERLL